MHPLRRWVEAVLGVKAVLGGGVGIGVGGVGACGVIMASKAIADLELIMNCAALFMSFRS